LSDYTLPEYRLAYPIGTHPSRGPARAVGGCGNPFQLSRRRLLGVGFELAFTELSASAAMGPIRVYLEMEVLVAGRSGVRGSGSVSGFATPGVPRVIGLIGARIPRIVHNGV